MRFCTRGWVLHFGSSKTASPSFRVSNMPTNSVLLVTYLFPPIGGPGVQRNLKYVKYLPKFNWDPWVLTVKHINYHVYDSSLLSEIQDPQKVIRTESLDPLRLTS